MARVRRTLQRRQFRLSLDPLDPVEGEALRRIDLLVEHAREMLGDDVTQEEAERFSFKRLLLELLSNRPAEMTAAHRAERPRPTGLEGSQGATFKNARSRERAEDYEEIIHQERAAAPAAATPPETAHPAQHWAEDLIKAPEQKPVSPVLQGLAWQDTDEDG